MNYNNNKIIDIAIRYGCKTAKDFATFLKRYNPQIKRNKEGREVVQLSLF